MSDEPAHDTVGEGLVHTLIARAEGLPPAARARLLERADLLADHYRTRAAWEAPCAPSARAAAPDVWSEVLAARARARAPRAQRARATTSFVAELRATSATTRAAEQVPTSAGPYHGAAVASRALAELLAVAPAYVGRYVEWLEDLAGLADGVERRATPRK